MGDIVSLKLVRKAKARVDKENTASENRAKFGLSKAQKKLTLAEKTKAETNLDGHKRET